MPTRPFQLGRDASKTESTPFLLSAHHLVTHGVVVGMTGSGKTGLCIGLVEEAVRSRVPALLVDVKGDLGNLALLFDALDADAFLPWVDADAAKREGTEPRAVAEALAKKWKEGLASWGIAEADVRALKGAIALRIVTPGTTAGEPLAVLSPLETRSELWDTDEEAAREALSAALSLLLRMVDRDSDPTKSREHVLLAHLAERRLRAGQGASLEKLLADLASPPIDRVGAMSTDEFLSPKDRTELAQALNALVASPTFSSWRQGVPLDVGAWMRGSDPAKVPVTIVSVAHLGDEERALVLSLLLEQTLAYVRGLSGTTDLRALVLFDEVFGFLPPHPKNPPTKRPLLALLKQARAFGVGLVLATQNPIDLDYKALSNAGVWLVGRLQTDADRERVVEGLSGSDAGAAGGALEPSELGAVLKSLPPRTFYVRNVHAPDAPRVMETRWTMSYLRGPLTRQEIRKLTKASASQPRNAEPSASASAPASASASASASTSASASAPAPPADWVSLFAHPPAVASWRYVPCVAVMARATVASVKHGVSETRDVAWMAPLENGALDLARADDFRPGDYMQNAPNGARFEDAGEALSGARKVRAIEKTLRDLVLDKTSLSVFGNPVLDLRSAPGEDEAAFSARCRQAVEARRPAVTAEVMGRHDPKIQKLASQRDTLRASLAETEGSAPSGLGVVGAVLLGGKAGGARAIAQQNRVAGKASRLREKLADVDAKLAEAVAKRNHELASRQAELLGALAATVRQVIVPKKDAVSAARYALVWVARA